ncbi:DNA polymerase nu-like [Galleria mellonella]|uniref:DNA polymerase nu-like n=1 Tax=Galleria mellonella TaxID=7137 RepID=A0ABM3N6V1_GALME|nr:DNA polymerase nu-like [Galleria mellonella]
MASLDGGSVSSNTGRKQQTKRKKGVLWFRDSEIPNTWQNYDTEMDILNNIEKSYHFNTYNMPEVYKSTDLVQTRIEDETTNIDKISRFDPLTLSPTTRNTDFMDTNKFATNATESNNYNANMKTITWNEFFDTELLAENTDETTSKQNSVNSLNCFVIKDQIENMNDCNSNNYENNGDINIKTKKRKTTNKNTDKVLIKIKKTSESKHNFKKEKYTKAVKNWLYDVDSQNPVEEGNDVVASRIQAPDEVVLHNTKSKVFTENNIKTGLNKKMIQAQLANKDGVMKFRKPKEISTENCGLTIEDTTPIDKLESIKEIKSKSKFVAPIKVQIPVEDVKYNVIVLDHNSKICSFPDANEVFVTLIYSNGFCQLNSQHTENDCVIEGMMFCIDDTFYYVKMDAENFSEMVNDVLENKTVNCYDAKSLLILLKFQFNIQAKFTIIDAKIGGSLFDPDNPPESFVDLQKQLSVTPKYTIASECVLQKTAWYIMTLKECVVRLSSLLREQSLWRVFIEIEMRLLPIIAEMEHRGITVDMEKLKVMEDILLTKIKMVEEECYKVAGRSFQINSPAQVRAILYDELQLDTKCNIKIRETICKGAKSTSESMLRGLVSVHPLPNLILVYRHLYKAHATFLSGIAQHVVDGVLRPTWVQTAAATGRIASSNPNVQAIPKTPFSLNAFPEGDKCNDESQLLNFRSVYVAREGCVLLAADFKHVECRVFAYIAGDTVLLDALKSGDDIFRVLAAKWLNKSEGEVSSEDRERTKRIVYASLYGAGTRKLMDILHVTYEQALTILASFNRRFPSLKSFGRSVVSQCEEQGGSVVTPSGRRRQLRGLQAVAGATELRAQAERQAVNFVVQGSAADICKTAMIVTEQRLRCSSPPLAARLLLQIHDELVWELPHAHLHTAAGIIKEAMENCGYECGLAIRLPVAVSAGRSWGEMRPFEHT